MISKYSAKTIRLDLIKIARITQAYYKIQINPHKIIGMDKLDHLIIHKFNKRHGPVFMIEMLIL